MLSVLIAWIGDSWTSSVNAETLSFTVPEPRIVERKDRSDEESDGWFSLLVFSVVRRSFAWVNFCVMNESESWAGGNVPARDGRINSCHLGVGGIIYELAGFLSKKLLTKNHLMC